MNFSLSEEHLMIRQAARDFAQNDCKPGVIERDTNMKWPAEQVKKMAELGFLGMMVSPEYGGGGMDTLSYVIAMEEISKVDASCSVLMSVNNSLVCWGLEEFGTEEQKRKYIVPLAKGEKIGAFCLSEPEAGSDATSQSTIAIDMGDFARARAEWEFVLHLSPSDAAAQKGLGFLCFQQGEFEHAALWLAAALAADPSDHSLAAALATVRATIAAGEATADTTGNAASDASGDNASALPDGAWETAPTVRASAQVSDARALFDAVIGDQPQTVLLIDRDGFVVAGQYVTADGRDLGADLGAQLSGISDEAARAVRHLGLGAWHQIVFESEAASVAMAPSVDGVLLVASPRSVPLGYVRRLLERSLERVGRWLETGT